MLDLLLKNFVFPKEGKFMYYAARQQHIEWLREKLAEEEARLAEAQARVLELQGSVAYYKQVIEQLMPTTLTNDSPKGDTSLDADNNSGQVGNNLLVQGELIDDEETKEENQFDSDEEDESKLNPKDMLLPKFKEKTLGDIAEIFLRDAKGGLLTAEYIARQIFSTSSQDEFQRAKSSLATELRRGAREGRWEKNGRGMFSANPESVERQEMITERGNGFFEHKPSPLNF